VKIDRWIAPALILAAMSLSAAVNIELSGGVNVQSSGSVLVQIDGNITSDGLSYYAGTLSSGPRTGLTDFSGLHLNPGVDGTVTCMTGSGYAEGNGEGTNFKRWYRIENAGSETTTDMRVDFIGSGTDDERNGLTGPFFIYRYASPWTGYGFGTDASPDTADGVVIPAGTSDWVLSEGCRVAAKLFLEGPYKSAGDTMIVALGADRPVLSPYSEDARTVTAVPPLAVDWVLVEVRSRADSAAVALRSCFIRSNGNIIADDGNTSYIPVKSAPGDYYLVIRQRNHASVMTAAKLTGLTWGVTPSQYEFNSGIGQYYGTAGAKQIETGVWGMWGGDVNQDKVVTTTDYTQWYNSARLGESGYRVTDINMDAVVTTNDYTMWYNNARAGATSKVP
jgi:hypothetical protein